MILHWAKHIESEHIGRRVARVECAKCGCDYFYLLTRIGSGQRSAHYGLGVGRAKRLAQRQAERDLQRRLKFEAELVPCPKCGWINDELVRGYRLGRFRGLGSIAPWAGVIGAISSLILIVTGFAFLRNPADRSLLPLFLIVGPAVFMCPALFIVGLRIWLRNRIRPNRDFPFPPKLPHGSPPALVKDDRGELVPAQTSSPRDVDLNNWIDLRIGSQPFPDRCCNCLGPSAAAHGYKILATKTLKLDVPCCEACSRDVNRRYLRIWSIGMTVGCALAFAALSALNLDSETFWICFVPCSIFSLIIAAYAASAATAPAKIISGADRSRGVIRLQFRNAEYPRVMAESLSNAVDAV